MFSRYFRYSIGSTGRIHRDGGDKSINSVYSHRLLTSLLCLNNEKENKRKEIKHVVGGEGDKNRNVKIKEKSF